MKKTGFFAGLSKSTRMTVIGCACFLVMSAAIVIFLMLCPVEPKTRSMEVRPSSNSFVEGDTSAQETEGESRRQERPTEKLPLSTWGVTFNHSTFNRDDYHSSGGNNDETIDMEDLPMGEDPTETPQGNTGGNDDPTQDVTDGGNGDTGDEPGPPATEPDTQEGPISTDPPEPPPATDPPVDPEPTAAPPDPGAEPA